MSDFPEHLFDNEIKEIHLQTIEDFGNIKKSLIHIAKEIENLKNQKSSKLSSSNWKKSLDASVKNYQNLIKKYQKSKASIDISTYGKWVNQRNQLLERLGKINIIQKESDLVDKKLKQTTCDLIRLRKELFESRSKFIDDVIGKNKYVRMELVQFGDVEQVEVKYRSILNIERNRFSEVVYEEENNQSILWDFINWEKEKKSESELKNLINAIKSNTLDIANGCSDRKVHGKFVKSLSNIKETNPTALDKLEAWWPEDMLRVKYSVNHKFHDLKKGSDGQKAAAILAFLLSYGNEPLIIDQPEDDLDNALIYNLVVEQIRQNINKRQYIIATHNPNIVVNGNSDLIHVLKFENAQVKIDKQNGLEDSNIRNEICNIMEGGKVAFKKRYRRIALQVE